MIQVHEVSKTFGEVKALQQVSLTAPDGQITGLLGPNGAGKTTLLRMLYMILKPEQGFIEVDGLNLQENMQAVARRLGALPHSHELYERLTSREHVYYYGELHGLSRAQMQERSEELFRILNMEDIKDRRTAGFSQGQRVKVALARALVHHPQNIILDEPTSGLDVMSRRNIRELLQELKSQGRCIVLSTHLMQELAVLCDRIVIIAKGKVAAVGSPDELKEQTKTNSLEDAFVAAIEKMGEPA